MDKYAQIPLYIAHAILLYTSNHVLVTANAQSYMKSDPVLFQKKKDLLHSRKKAMHVQYRHCLLHTPFYVWLIVKWGMQI